MGVTCLVLGCGSRSNRDKLGFYTVPTPFHSKYLTDKNKLSKKRRDLWLAAVKRVDLSDQQINNQRVCGKHFITGKPASLDDVNNPDWVPSQNMNEKSKKVSKKVKKIDKRRRVYTRRKLRQKLVENKVGAAACVNENESEEKVYVLLISVPMNQNSPSTNVPS